METFGNRIERRRKELGLSQTALATMVGLRQQTIDGMEKTPKRRSRYIVPIAAALGVRPEWLDTGMGPMFPEDTQPTTEEAGRGPESGGSSGKEDHLPADLLSDAAVLERAGRRTAAVARVHSYLGAISKEERPPRVRRRPT